MTEQPLHDQAARNRLIELGVLPVRAVASDPRWTETLNVPVSTETSETLEWLSGAAGTGLDVLAAKVVEISLIKADLEVSKAAQCARGPHPVIPRYYAPLIGALRHGNSESKLAAELLSFEPKDWREIISDAANPSHNALDTLAELAGFADRGAFVVHLLKLSNLTTQARSSIAEQISEHRRAMRFLDTIERATY
ncbi:MAG: hypothetical protein RL518_2660 [Pseudomonadota bacterium]|jgi:hypothetical protein